MLARLPSCPVSIVILKTCTKCKSEKSTNDFSADRKRKDGKQPWCKACMSACGMKYRKNSEIKAQSTALRRKQRVNPEFREKENESARNRRATNPDFKRSQSAYWRAYYSDPDNQETRKERHRQLRTDVNVRAKALLAGAKQRDPNCTVTFDHVLSGIQRGHCPVTGIIFDLTSDHQKITGRSRNPYSPSIDRVDSNLGYTNENTRIVITHYNFMKGQLTDEEMRFICGRVVGISSK